MGKTAKKKGEEDVEGRKKKAGSQGGPEKQGRKALPGSEKGDMEGEEHLGRCASLRDAKP